MNEETAQEATFIKKEIDETRSRLKDISTHSFGFGTSSYDIDETLRPLTKIYFESKLITLINKLNNLT